LTAQVRADDQQRRDRTADTCRPRNLRGKNFRHTRCRNGGRRLDDKARDVERDGVRA
jgi:hypothetical protein